MSESKIHLNRHEDLIDIGDGLNQKLVIGVSNYQDDSNVWQEVNTDIETNLEPVLNDGYEVGLNKAEIQVRFPDNLTLPIIYKMRTGVEVKQYFKGIGFYNTSTKEYQLTTETLNTQEHIHISGNEILYEDIYSGVDFKFVSGTESVKEELIISSAARTRLVSPYPEADSKIIIYFEIETGESMVDEDGNNVFVTSTIKETDKEIKIANDLKMPFDIAFMDDDRDGTKWNMKKYTIKDGNKKILLSGIDYSIFKDVETYSGSLVLDPTITLLYNTASFVAYFLASGSPTSYYNNINQTTVITGYNSSASFQKCRGYTYFSLSSILDTYVISEAHLIANYNNYAATNIDFKSYALKRDVSNPTWNQYSSGNNWDTSGGLGTNDIYSTALDDQLVSGAGAITYNIDFTESTKYYAGTTKSGNPNKGWLHQSDNENSTGSVNWRSNHSATLSKCLKLAITYSIPVGVPTGVGATSNLGDKVTVTWNTVSGATGYKIYRSDTSDGTYTLLNTQAGTSYDDTTAEITMNQPTRFLASNGGSTDTIDLTWTEGTVADRVYYYKVKAYDGGGDGALSTSDAGNVDASASTKNGTEIYVSDTEGGSYTLLNLDTASPYAHSVASNIAKWYKLRMKYTVTSIQYGSYSLIMHGSTSDNTTELTKTNTGYYQGTNATYSTARTSRTSSSSSGAIIGQNYSGGMYTVYRSFHTWETSSIPTNATVTSVVYNYMSGSTNYSDKTWSWSLRDTTYTTLMGDFTNYGSTVYGNFDEPTPTPTSIDKDYALNATGIAYVQAQISTSSDIKMMAMSDEDYSSTAPAESAYMLSTGTLKLTVNYTVPPDAPTGVTATSNFGSKVTVSWNTVSGATGYKIYRSETSGSGFSQIGTTGSLTYDDTTAEINIAVPTGASASKNKHTTQIDVSWAEGVISNKNYYYKVISTSAGGDSEFSSEVTGNVDSSSSTKNGTEIHSSDTESGSYTLLNLDTASPYAHTGLSIDTTKWYKLRMKYTVTTIQYSSYTSVFFGLAAAPLPGPAGIDAINGIDATDIAKINGMDFSDISAIEFLS